MIVVKETMSLALVYDFDDFQTFDEICKFDSGDSRITFLHGRRGRLDIVQINSEGESNTSSLTIADVEKLHEMLGIAMQNRKKW